VAILGGDQLGRCWGVMWGGGGCSGHFGSGRGLLEVARAHAREVVVVASPVWAGEEEEANRGRAESGAGPEFKKNLFEFQLFLEFGRTLENCTRRFRKNIDMGIFPKII
jgi:hypothetical protein